MHFSMTNSFPPLLHDLGLRALRVLGSYGVAVEGLWFGEFGSG